MTTLRAPRQMPEFIRMNRAVRPVVLALALALGSASCDESLSDVAGPTPNLEPTFSSIQQEIFNTTDSSGRQSCISCHVAGGPAAFLLLTEGVSYNNLVNRTSGAKPGAIRVIPGDPDNSYLVQKLEGAPGIVGQRMPRTSGPFLTSGQVSIIRRWIELGANND
jgi:hypothetical protein